MNSFIVIGIAVLFLIYLIFKSLSMLNKASDYSAKNSFRNEGNFKNKSQYESNSNVERILIKGHKFSSSESYAIWEAIKKGNKDEALWLIRSAPGISSNDAKKFVESKVKLNKGFKAEENKESIKEINQPSKTHLEKSKSVKLELSNSQYNTLIAALESDNKIAAIKLIREYTGLEYAESKNFIGIIIEKMQAVSLTKEMVDAKLKQIGKVNSNENNDFKNNKTEKKSVSKLNKSELELIRTTLESGNKINALQLLSEITGLGWHEVNNELRNLEKLFFSEKEKTEIVSQYASSENKLQITNQTLEPTIINDKQSSAEIDNQQISELILNALSNRSKIEAINLFKEATGFNLKESLEFIEKIDGKIKQAPVKEIALNKFAKLLATEISLGTKADVNRIN